MKYKRILSLIAALCLSISLCGCGEKNNSSKDKNSGSSSENEDSFVLPENIEYCTTENELFEFAVSAGIPNGEGSELLGDTEFVFNAGDEDTLIGVMSVMNLHQTASGMGKGLSVDFEESGLYSNIQGEDLTINGNPAYRFTADCENDILYTLTTMQFGNGDIFVVMSTSSPAHREDCQRETDIILHSAEYKGDPLKNKPETFENDYFSITIEPKWYFRREKEDFASIGLNLQNDYNDIWYSFSFSALTDEPDVKTAAENAAAKLENQEITRDESTFMGYDSEHIFYEGTMGAYIDYYIFEKDGKCYQAITACHKDLTEQYNVDIQKVIDGIIIK